MIAAITADIMNSRTENAGAWLPVLKQVLAYYGTSPRHWEIYRGDSFQLILPPVQALQAALHIKAGIKQLKHLDVRIGIGIGEEDHSAAKVTESNGTAYVRSGECFDTLKKQNLGISTSHPQVDETMNLLFSLALLSMNSWSPTVAGVIKISLEHPEKNQQEIAAMLNRSQSSISEALSRGGFEEIMRMNAFYQKQLEKL